MHFRFLTSPSITALRQFGMMISAEAILFAYGREERAGWNDTSLYYTESSRSGDTVVMREMQTVSQRLYYRGPVKYPWLSVDNTVIECMIRLTEHA